MKTCRAFMLGAILLSLVACTTTEKMDWVAISGSKADGNVTLGIDVPPKLGISETEVQWDVSQANTEADKRCQNWGYSGADMYRGKLPVLETCHAQGFSTCWSKEYRIQYQCISKN